jgi:hypothetical protein
MSDKPVTGLVERLRDLDAKATPRPWKASPYRGHVGSQVWAGERGENAVLICADGDADDVDAALIAEVRNALPEIIAELERLTTPILDVEREAIRAEAFEEAAQIAEQTEVEREQTIPAYTEHDDWGEPLLDHPERTQSYRIIMGGKKIAKLIRDRAICIALSRGTDPKEPTT